MMAGTNVSIPAVSIGVSKPPMTASHTNRLLIISRPNAPASNVHNTTRQRRPSLSENFPVNSAKPMPGKTFKALNMPVSEAMGTNRPNMSLPSPNKFAIHKAVEAATNPRSMKREVKMTNAAGKITFHGMVIAISSFLFNSASVLCGQLSAFFVSGSRKYQAAAVNASSPALMR